MVHYIVTGEALGDDRPKGEPMGADFLNGYFAAGSIVVADQSFAVTQDGVAIGENYLVAGVAETEGLQQTRWKSDLAILNPGTASASIDLIYRHDGVQENSTLEVGPGTITELANVAVDTFGAPDSAGAVELQSTVPLIVTARTYNAAPSGTFGQFIPGVTSALGIAAGAEATLSQLSSSSEVRTNIGFVDLGGTGAMARIRLFDGSGAAVGSELGEIIPAGGWSQRNRVFHAAIAGDCMGCYAVVDIVGNGGPIWAYASVVDAASGDPTTIPMERIDTVPVAGDERYLVAGVASTDGANQTRWKSNLALLNLSGQGVTADLTYRHSGGSEVSSVTLGDGELHEFANIAADLFGADRLLAIPDEVAGTNDELVVVRVLNRDTEVDCQLLSRVPDTFELETLGCD